MEVELSGATEHDATVPPAEDAEPDVTRTPKRAAEVFGFLTERRKSVLERQRSVLDRAFAAPMPPPKDEPAPSKQSTSSPDTSDTSMTSFAQIHTATLTKFTHVLNPLSRSTDSVNMLRAPQLPLAERPTPSNFPQHTIRSHMTGDSLSTVASATSSKSTSRIPRGPRATPSDNNSRTTRPHKSSSKPTRAEVTMDLPTPAPTPVPRSRAPKQPAPEDPSTPIRPRTHKRRATAHTSGVVTTSNDDENSARMPRKHNRKNSRAEVTDKENSPPTAVPLRTIFDMRHPNLMNGEPPSPASSSELSPIAKEMMVNLRKQRLHTREQVRSAGRSSRRHS